MKPLRAKVYKVKRSTNSVNFFNKTTTTTTRKPQHFWEGIKPFLMWYLLVEVSILELRKVIWQSVFKTLNVPVQYSMAGNKP